MGMHNIKKHLPEGFQIDYEKIVKLLERSGFDSYSPFSMSFRGVHTPDSLKEEIKKFSEETEFPLTEEPRFNLFYTLDDVDGKNAFLYSPDFDCSIHFPHPTKGAITKVSKGLTRLIPLPLLSIYEGEKWKIPRLGLYENGKLTGASEGFVGESAFDPNWENNYWKRLARNADKHAGEYVDRAMEALLL